MQQPKIKTKVLLQSLKPKKDATDSPEDRLRLVMEQIRLRFDRLSQSVNPNDSVQPVGEKPYNSLFSLVQAISILLDLSKPDGLQEFLASLVSQHISKLRETFRRLYTELELPKPQALKNKQKPDSTIPETSTGNNNKETAEKENAEEDVNIIKNELRSKRRPATNHFTSGLTNTTVLFHSVASPKRKRIKTVGTTFTPKYSKSHPGKEGEEGEEGAQEPSAKKSRVVVGDAPFATITSPRRPSPMTRSATARGRGGAAASKGRGASSLRSLFLAQEKGC